MTRIFLLILSVIAATLVWVLLVFFGFSEGWSKKSLTRSDEAAEFAAVASEVVKEQHFGNLSMLLIENGDVAERFNYSVDQPVTGASLFQVASLGKWITAYGVMVLIEEGVIDLDTPISQYLTRWRLPDSEFDSAGVTVRRLLSHTSGLVDGLGYDGFASPEEVQTLEASLTRALDHSPNKSGIVELGAEPGSEWRYSGGGYTILQLLIEEASSQSFADFMDDRVFSPLGMSRTTFDHHQAARLGLVQNFALDGDTKPFRWYTALAATSLFTSADDMAIFMKAHTTPAGGSGLSPETLALMRTPHASQMGADIWGLGPMLYASNNQGGHIIGHDGSNGPAINTVARFDPATGNGIVILSTGNETLATELAGEWVFWKTGNIDSLMFLMSFDKMLLWMGVGSVAVVLGGAAFGWSTRNRRKTLAASLRRDNA